MQKALKGLKTVACFLMRVLSNIKTITFSQLVTIKKSHIKPF